ncbi:MAG TPA: hypothetical protein VGE74_25465 [Gemmata sp.]
MADRPSASQFWQSVALRLIVIWLIGWATVLWFRGCLIPTTRDELRDNHQKALPTGPPTH